MAMEHHGIKDKARQTHSKAVGEAVYHKSVLHNYHMQHAKFKCQHNRLYHFLNQICSQLASISIA